MRKVQFNNGKIDIDVLKDLILRDCREIKTLFSIGFEKSSFNMEGFFEYLKEAVLLVSWNAKAIDGIENDFITLEPFHVHYDLIKFPSKEDINKLNTKEGELPLDNCIVVDITIFFNLKLIPKFKGQN